MPAISGEPFRGLAKVKLDDGLGNRRAYTASIDAVTPDTATGQQTTWEGAPGASVTLRLQWDSVGAPVFGAADTVSVKVRLPGSGSDIGSTWSPAISGNSGVATTTMHFDDNPLDGSAGTNRAGMLEVLLTVSRAAAVAWGPMDSRGGSSTPPAGATFTWARGYLRSRVTVSAFSISDASLGGAEPGAFYATKATFNRVTLADACYRGVAVLVKHRQAAADVRSSDADTPTDTAAQRDYTWNASATGAANKGRINKDYAATSTATDVQVVLSGPSFGSVADVEYDLAASGNIAGWTRTNEFTLEKAARFTVDPRVRFTQILQANDNTWHTTPITGDVVPAGQRLTSDLDFLAARATDNAGTPAGLNGVTWTEKLWDNGQLLGSEASPVKSRSSTGSTQGTQAGWSDAFLSWDNGLPTGSWTQKEVITTTDLVGLELSNTRSLQLIAKDPRVRLVGTAGDPDNPGRHWSPGQKLVVGFAITKKVSSTTAQVLAPDAGTGRFALMRFKPGTARKEYLDPTDLSAGAAGTWKESVGTAAFNLFTAAASPGDSTLQLYTFAAADTTAAKGWNFEDMVAECWLDAGGATEVGSINIPVLDTRFPHDGDDSATEAHIATAVATEATNRIADVDAEEAARIAAVAAEATARSNADAAEASARADGDLKSRYRVTIDARPVSLTADVVDVVVRCIDANGDPVAPTGTPTLAAWLGALATTTTPYAAPTLAATGDTGVFQATLTLPGVGDGSPGQAIFLRALATINAIAYGGFATIQAGNPLSLAQYTVLTQGGLADALHHHSTPMDPAASRFTSRAGATPSPNGWEAVQIDKSIRDPTLAAVVAQRKAAKTPTAPKSLVATDRRPPETFAEGSTYTYDDGRQGPVTYVIARKEPADHEGARVTKLTLNVVAATFVDDAEATKTRVSTMERF